MLIYLFRFFNKYISNYSERFTNEATKLSSLITQAIQSYEYLKVTNQEKKLNKKSYQAVKNTSKYLRNMGILNLTPDSFSDGGKFIDFKSAEIQINNLINSGANIIDIGGESTRPGAKDIPVSDEWKRISNKLRLIKKKRQSSHWIQEKAR